MSREIVHNPEIFAAHIVNGGLLGWAIMLRELNLTDGTSTKTANCTPASS
jgi:hypothetical protein